MDEHGGDGALAGHLTRLNDCTGREPVRVGLDVEHIGLQRNHLHERVEAFARLRRDGGVQHVATKLLEDHLVLEELELHLGHVRLGLVALGEGDNDRHVGRLGRAYRRDRLLHDALVRRDHEDDDVGHVRAARSHLREGRVPRRVEEGHGAAGLVLRANTLWEGHRVRADVLRDAARLTGRHAARRKGTRPVGVEERRLAVIDVAHDRHYRRSALQGHVLVLILENTERRHVRALGIFESLAARHLGAVALGDLLRGVRVDELRDRGEHAHLHQILDHGRRPHVQRTRQIADGDSFAQGHLRRARLHRRRHDRVALGALFARVARHRDLFVRAQQAATATALLLALHSFLGSSLLFHTAALALALVLVLVHGEPPQSRRLRGLSGGNRRVRIPRKICSTWRRAERPGTCIQAAAAPAAIHVRSAAAAPPLSVLARVECPRRRWR